MVLTARQEVFIVEYLKCRNATEAARRAGYSQKTARQMGSENLSKPDILAEIKRRTEENAMGLDEALSRLADMGRADMGLWLTDDGYIDIAAMKRAGATHMIRKVKRKERSGVSESGTAWHEVDTEVELHDAKDANKFIAELHTRGPSGKEDDPFHLSINDARERITSRIAGIAERNKPSGDTE